MTITSGPSSPVLEGARHKQKFTLTIVHRFLFNLPVIGLDYYIIFIKQI